MTVYIGLDVAAYSVSTSKVVLVEGFLKGGAFCFGKAFCHQFDDKSYYVGRHGSVEWGCEIRHISRLLCFLCFLIVGGLRNVGVGSTDTSTKVETLEWIVMTCNNFQ